MDAVEKKRRAQMAERLVGTSLKRSARKLVLRLALVSVLGVTIFALFRVGVACRRHNWC